MDSGFIFISQLALCLFVSNFPCKLSCWELVVETVLMRTSAIVAFTRHEVMIRPLSRASGQI